MSKHPDQPIEMVGDVVRFRANPIVRAVLDAATEGRRYDMNAIAADAAEGRYDDEDLAHFAQLIGYSVAGWGSLSYVSPEACAAADAEAERVLATAAGEGRGG